MTSEEYLDSLLQSLGENAEDGSSESPLIKQVFSDLDDRRETEETIENIEELLAALPEDTEEVFDASTENTEELFGAATENADELFGAATENVDELFGAAMENADELFGAAMENADELLGAATENTEELFGDAIENIEDLLVANDESLAVGVEENSPAEAQEEDWKVSLDELLAAADSQETSSEVSSDMLADMLDNLDALPMDSFGEMQQETSAEEMLGLLSGNQEEAVTDIFADAAAVEEMDVTQLIDSMEGLDGDLAEINDLLKKSDNNEAVEADMMALFNAVSSEGESVLSEEEASVLFGDQSLDAENVEADEKGKKRKDKKFKLSGLKKKKKEKESEQAEPSDVSDNDTKEKAKGQGVLSRLFQALTEEAESDSGAASDDENEEILKELEAEDKKKGKKKDKKEKKSKKEKPQKEKKQKAEKPKKEKKKKEKPDKESGTGKEYRPISKRTMILMVAFCATMIAAVVALSFFLNDYAEKKKAREAFYHGDYEETYELLYGKKLTTGDALILNRVRLVLELQRKLDIYEFHRMTGDEARALCALLDGVEKYEELIADDCFGAENELATVYQQILTLLTDSYGIKEATAKELNSYGEEAYSLAVYEIISGEYNVVSESEQPEEKTEEKQDVLPAETDLIQ